MTCGFITAAARLMLFVPAAELRKERAFVPEGAPITYAPADPEKTMFCKAIPVDKLTGLELSPNVVMALLKVAVSVTALGNAAVQFAELFQLASSGAVSQVPLAAFTFPVSEIATVSVDRAN
jgi:hypothetical protein